MEHSFDLNVGYPTEEEDNESFGVYGDNFDDGDSTSMDEEGNNHGNNDEVQGDQDNQTELGEDDEGYTQILPPHPGMTFAHSREVFEYVHAYGKAIGFQYMIRSSEKHNDPNGPEKYKRLRLACSKYGKFESNSKKPAIGSTSCVTGCKFKVNAAVHADGRWVIGGVNLEHNHECVPNNSRLLPNYRVINERNKNRILNSDRAGVPIAKNFGTFVVEHGSNAAVPFNNRDCRNLISKARRHHMENGDFVAMRKHFEEMSSSNSNFFYSYDLDEDNRLGNVFWADGRSRAMYEEFGDVVCFDTTYVSNRYKMPFAPFIGVNNHGQSVLFGCALLAQEEIGNFVWLFRTWLTCMSGKAPTAIITDQCRSIGNAVAQVFPNTSHRWCIWHVMQNAHRQLGKKEDWKDIHRALQNILHESYSVEEFEAAWKKMIDCYRLDRNKWLLKMYDCRNRWVPIYFKDHFWAGMSSTQRSEGMNHFFKRYVNINTTLTIFVEQYGLALSDRVNAEIKANFESLNSPRHCLTDHVFEVVFQRLYTTVKFTEFQMEVGKQVYNNATKIIDDGQTSHYDIVVKQPRHDRPNCQMFRVVVDNASKDMKCECKNFEFRGILCTHILRVFTEEQLDFVPEKYILDRWRKDLPRQHLKVSVPYYKLLDKRPEGSQRIANMHAALDESSGIAMNDAELYAKVMATLNALKIEIKNLARDKHGLKFHTMDNIGKVYGRRQLHRHENNDSTEADPAESACNGVKDPVDQRGKGRALSRRLGFGRDSARGRQGKRRNTNSVIGEQPSQSTMQTSSVNHQVNLIPHPNLVYPPMLPPYAFDRYRRVNPPLHITEQAPADLFQPFMRHPGS